jgi:hypothetical protein
MRRKSNARCLFFGAVGASTMCLFDPVSGRRRRALIGHKFVFVRRKVDAAFRVSTRDLANRARGVAAEAKRYLTHEEVPDQVLVERIRAALGRVVSHPSAIDVEANQGKVALHGLVLREELGRLLRRVNSVRGVRKLENRLEAREEAFDTPELQGGSRRESRFEFAQSHWSPAARLLAGITGGVLAISGSRSRQLTSRVSAAVGLALLARSITNVDLMGTVLGSHRGEEDDRFGDKEIIFEPAFEVDDRPTEASPPESH